MSILGFIGDRIKNTASSVGEVFMGIITLDFNRALEGALNAVTFGAYGVVKDWVSSLIPEMPEQTFQSRKVMSRGSDTPRQIVYGRARVGGQLVFFSSTGGDSQVMFMIVVLAPHRSERIREVYFNDEFVLSLENDVGAGPYSPSSNSPYAGKVQIWRKLGFTGSAQTLAIPGLSTTTSGEWTTTYHRLEGQTYIVARLEYDRELFRRGMPSISAVVEGKRLFDPRDSSTTYTDNHALAVLDFIRSQDGLRATDAEIDFDSFEHGANVSDEMVAGRRRLTGFNRNGSPFPWKWTPIFGAPDEPRYTVNGTISLAANPIDNLSSLTRSGAATVLYTQGRWRYIAGEYNAPIANFDESDLVGGLSFATGPGKAQITNTLRGTYIDPLQDYEPVSFPEISPGGHLADDGEELATEVPMPFANSPTLARRLAKILVERERFGVSLSITLKYTASAVDVGDRITLSIADLGWTNKVFRVEQAQLTFRQGIILDLREDGEAVWSWSEGEAIDIEAPEALNLPERTPIAAPTGLAVNEQVNQPLTPRGNQTTLTLTATPPADPRFAYIRFQYRLLGDDQWIDIRYDVVDRASITVFADSRQYEISAQSVSTQGVVSDTRRITTYRVALVTNDPNETDSDDEAITIPKVRRLEIVNRVDDDEGYNQWTGPDCEIEWAKLSITGGGSITNPDGFQDLHLKGYRIQIFRASDNEMLRELETLDTRYVYTLADNIKDNGGTPTRDVRFVLAAVSTTGKASEPTTLEASNPAPAAPTGIVIDRGFDTVGILFTLPSDADYVGANLYLLKAGSGDPYELVQPVLVSGNTYLWDGLLLGSDHRIGIESVDRFGVGGRSAVFDVTTKTIDAADVDGLGVWATEDEVSAAFVQTYMAGGSISEALIASNAVIASKIASGAVESDKLAAQAVTNSKLANLAVDAAKLAESSVTATKIANLAVGTAAIQTAAVTDAKIQSLTVAKVTTGQITVQWDLGTGILLDGTTGVIESINSGYSAFMGPVNRAAVSANPLIFHSWNGTNAPFWVDASGNGAFGKLSLGADGSIGSDQFEISADGNALFTGEIVTSLDEEDARVEINKDGDNRLRVINPEIQGGGTALTLGQNTIGGADYLLTIEASNYFAGTRGLRVSGGDQLAAQFLTTDSDTILARTWNEHAVRAISLPNDEIGGFSGVRYAGVFDGNWDRDVPFNALNSNGILARSERFYGGVFQVNDQVRGAPVRIVPLSSSSAPTHTANVAIGAMTVTSTGVLYIYTSSGWQKVGAQ